MNRRVDAVLESVVRDEWRRLVALLLGRYRRLDLVEDALADAVEAAARRWPLDGVPANPPAWLLTTARRRILDRMRAEAMAHRKSPLLEIDAPGRRASSTSTTDPSDLVEDDVLRLILMCAHPALAPESSSALALRLVMGVSTHDIARLFLVSESTVAARVTRAKRKIVAAGIPFSIPGSDELPDRLEMVAQTAYLAFTAGYAPGSGTDLLRVDLASEAIRLVRAVHTLRPHHPAVTALLSLALLQHSRRDARVDAGGRLVLLGDQDRALWRSTEIDEALALLADPVLRGPVSQLAASYQLQARIAAEHARATSHADTRWERIVGSYDLLLQVVQSPSVRLARAVAVAECSGPDAGLAALDGIGIPGSHRVPAVRAELMFRTGRLQNAAIAYDEAINLCRNEAERAHLVEQQSRCWP